MEQHIGIIVLLFIVSALLIGAVLRGLLRGGSTPYSVALLLLGLAIGLMDRWNLAGDANHLVRQIVTAVAEMDPHLILFIFLPTLIFESAFAIETHLFRRTFGQIAMLAVPGLLICTGLTAVLVKYALPWDWSWPVALMFGALISATDPVAVVALLREMSSRKRLETLIEGESLLNDGTAIVLFTLFYGMLSMPAGGNIELAGVAAQFTWVVSAGFLVGLVLGWAVIYWIGRTFNDPLIEISLSIAVAYLVFYVAEGALHVSGVVALVTLGIIFAGVGRTRISPEVAGFLHRFWEVMAHIANTLIFLLVGIMIASRVQLDDPRAWIALAVLYLGIMAIRTLSVTALLPLLSRIGIGFGRDKAIVLIWGGLRGAVALALALSVVQSDVVDPATANQILFLCAGIVVLTIVINGSTFSQVLARLGLDRLPAAKQVTVDKAEQSLRRDMQPLREDIQRQALLEHADWDEIEAIVQRVRMPLSDNNIAPAAAPEAMSIAFQRRILEAERKNYWRQFATGTLGRSATAALVGATEEALDGEPHIHPRRLDTGIPWWPRLLRWLLRHPRLENLLERVGFARLSLSYEIYRGFLFAQQESKRHLDKLAPTAETRKTIASAIDSNIQEATIRIAELREQYPDVASKLETRIAARQLLNQRRRLIEELCAEGVVDATQAERMTTAVEREMALLHRRSY